MPEKYSVSVDKLRTLVTKIFVKNGLTEEDAAIMADNLVDANERGMHSHGVLRVENYIKRMQQGGTDGHAEVKILHETPISATLDGGNGLGAVVSTKAMRLCRQKAEESFRAFREQPPYEDDLARLNGLIYFAMPFRAGEEKTVALLLPLQGLSDGKMVQQAIIDARKQHFFPEMLRLTEELKAAGVFHYSQSMLPELLWDSFSACFQRLMQEAAEIRQGGPTGGVIQIIEAERFMWERLLDAPFASMELIRGDEALLTISHAVTRLKRMESAQQEKENQE